MKHIEVEAPQKKKNPSVRSITSIISSMALALIVVGSGYTLTRLLPPDLSDHISDIEKAYLLDNYNINLPINIERIHEYRKEIENLPLDQDSKKNLENIIYKSETNSLPNQTVLAKIIVWDFAEGDGDAVRISSAGYEIVIQLKNTPTSLALPVDMSRIILITGVRDGGGGITIAVKSSENHVSLPVLNVGEALKIPVSF